jgi:RecQ family ATP-dependent DNA helicase
MKEFIAQHQNQSGIIYCCTKKDCEQVAENLAKVGIKIKHYHAALTTTIRSEVQREWQTGQIQVIAATIAFGMGIDKPDVRFVIHYSVPSSVEGYYQETGRAGRDGKVSVCRLYFSYGDTRTHNFLIEQGEGSWAQKQRQRDNLNTMMRFCDNRADCRRKLILSYFGETFSPSLCMRMCDNCIQNQHGRSMVKDISKEACTLIKMIKAIMPDHITVAQLIDIYRGSRARRIVDRGHDRLEGWGQGRDKQRTEVDRMLRAMIVEDAIRETAECNALGFPMTYLIVSIFLFLFTNERLTVFFFS